MPTLGVSVSGCGGGDAPWAAQAIKLQSLLDAQIREPGVYSAIGRLEIGDSVIFAGAAGVYSASDKTPVRPDTAYRSRLGQDPPHQKGPRKTYTACPPRWVMPSAR